MRRRGMVHGLAVLALAGGAIPVASCNLALGLNKYIDCPGDPSCPADATCSDGVKDGEETGVDCGGPCKACPDAQGCKVASDCTSTFCVQGMCVASTCNDKVKDGSETDVDCGGSCPPCADGKGCLTGSDCADKVCKGGACQPPSCNDGVKNGTETDVDCGGGGPCSPCGEGKQCVSNGDCAGMSCMGGTCQPTCNDGQQDGDETGVDCGGSCAPTQTCKDGTGCTVDGDCKSGICQSTKCTPVYVWSESFDDMASNLVSNVSLALDGSENVVLTGSFEGNLDVGMASLNAGTKSNSAFYAKFDPSGTLIWAKQSTDTTSSNTLLNAVAADSAGHTYLTGRFSQTLNIPGSGTLTGATNTGSLWVATIDTSGQCLQSGGYGTNGNLGGTGIAVDPGGTTVVVIGTLQGTVDFGGGPFTESTGGMSSYVAQFDSGLSHQWAKDLTEANLTSVAIDASGNVVVVGIFSYSASYGGPSMLTGSTGFTLGVAKFDSFGNYQWSTSFDPSNQFMNFPKVNTANVVIDTAGSIYLAGDYNGTIDFGGGTLDSMGQNIPFLAKLDPNGGHIWSKIFPDMAGAFTATVALDAKGQPTLMGTFTGTIDFGGGPLTSTGGQDPNGANIYLAKFSTSGTYLWSKSFGSAAGQTPTGFAVDSNNAAFLAGTFNGTLNFGTTPKSALTNPNSNADIFLAKLLTP